MPGLLVGIAVWLGWEAWSFADDEKRNADHLHQTVSDAVWEVRDSCPPMRWLVRAVLVVVAYHFGWGLRASVEGTDSH